MPLINVSENKKPLVVIVCLVLIAVSVFCMVNRDSSSGMKGANKVGEALGTILGEETGKLLKGKGEVVLISMNPKQRLDGKPQPEVIALEKAVKKAGLSVAGREYISINTELADIPADNFIKVINRYPKADAIISLLGYPAFKNNDLAAMPEKLPKLVGTAWRTTGVRRLVQQDIIQLVVVARPLQTSKSPRTMREWFDKYFEIYTAANAASLPE